MGSAHFKGASPLKGSYVTAKHALVGLAKEGAKHGRNLPTSDAVDLKVIRKLRDVLWQVFGRRAA